MDVIPEFRILRFPFLESASRGGSKISGKGVTYIKVWGFALLN